MFLLSLPKIPSNLLGWSGKMRWEYNPVFCNQEWFCNQGQIS